MSLSTELISQFVKVTRDQVEDKQATTLRGTVKVSGEGAYVQIDGSDVLTPVTLTSDVKNGDRVMVLIENHTATVMGNASDPAARVSNVQKAISTPVSDDVLEAMKASIGVLEAKSAAIKELEVINAQIENLNAVFANLTHVSAEEAKIINAEIDTLIAKMATIEDLEVEDLNAVNAEIANLKGYAADFTYLSVEVFEANKAEVEHLKADKADITFANIDFAKVGVAKIGELLAESGIIADLKTNNGYVTGELVGVTIKGDLIEAGTLKADKLVVKGDDGVFYKLNFESGTFTDGEPVPADGLHGSVIVANSITAEKVNVSDLVAFDATIGGFNITANSIYSEVKDSEGNTTRGIYMDTNGQINFGDTTNFIKYYNDPIYYRVMYDSSTDTFTSTDEVVVVGSVDEVIDNDEYRYTSDTGEKVYYDTTSADTVYCWQKDRYKLAVSADSIMYALNGSSRSIADIGALTEYVKIGTYYNEETDNEEPCIELGEHDSDFKLVITNTRILFKEGATVPAYINNESLHIGKAVIEEEMRVGGFVWKERANGNMSLTWEVNS